MSIQLLSKNLYGRDLRRCRRAWEYNIKIDLNVNKMVGCEMHLFGQDPAASSRQQGNNASWGFIKGEEFLARVDDNQTANKNYVQ